jgi:hypothetical protein
MVTPQRLVIDDDSDKQRSPVASSLPSRVMKVATALSSLWIMLGCAPSQGDFF